ncbi:MAG: sugar phosphate nucleotidyltransferase [Oscillospiraceae bacterium]|nr:sugar phosphate nucleotidyltransferase [Oscillospiraceae bacterium]
MTHEPTLVIMAAGMGSRFGGLKQMTPVDEEGHFIIDFSLYDAYQAGFRRVAFIIKREIEQTFRETIGARMEKWFHVDYVYQELDRLPEGFAVPEGRRKPWGTAHAVACCRGVVEGPFAVINSDDFYGRGAYEAIYRFLTENKAPHHYAMLGYQLRNTVTEFGSVARGVCHVQDGMLLDITERTKIFKRGQDAAYTEDGETFVPLSGDSLVSMNFWGFTPEILDEIWNAFPAFLAENLPANPEKCEFYLPTFVGSRLAEGKVRVRVLPCMETWHGVTYKEDLDSVKAAIGQLKREGKYPARLWE